MLSVTASMEFVVHSPPRATISMQISANDKRTDRRTSAMRKRPNLSFSVDVKK